MANEKRLIGYDPIVFGEFTQSIKNTLEAYNTYDDGYLDGVERIEDWLEFNYVDAVEVVRCKDCKWYDADCETCVFLSEDGDTYDFGCDVIMKSDDFCSYGERREGE